MRWYAVNAAGAAIVINSPDENSVAGGSLLTGYSALVSGASPANQIGAEVSVRTNTSAQVRAVSGAASSTVSGFAYGWLDYRGNN
jgi:hypothetical protein